MGAFTANATSSTDAASIYDFDSSTGKINGYSGSDTVRNIVIPSEINGDAVKIIGWFVFGKDTALTSVTIPNSVKEIGNKAFWDCSSLKNITFSDSVTTIDEEAFEGCTSLTSVTIGKGVTAIGDLAFSGCTSLSSITIPSCVTSIGGFAFDETPWLNNNHNEFVNVNDILIKYNGSAAHITIPNNVKCIGDRAFVNNHVLTNVTIPNSVTRINSGAFLDCDSLPSITIPSSVEKIDYNIFGGCSFLKEISVDSNNKYYSSKDGLLYNYDKTELIECPGGIGGNLSIKSGVTSIDDSVFDDCKSLTSLTLPDGVISVEDEFSGCISLTSLTIPRSVTRMSGFSSSKLIKLKVCIGSYAQSYAIQYKIPYITIPTITTGTYDSSTPTNKDIVVCASTDKGTLNTSSHTFKANGSFDFVATDTEGNVTTNTITITNIDKTAPVVTGVTNGSNYKDKKVITFNKGAALLNGIAVKSGYTVGERGNYTLIVTDAVGNRTTVKFTISSIIPIYAAFILIVFAALLMFFLIYKYIKSHKKKQA